jgi:hypothetical protein
MLGARYETGSAWSPALQLTPVYGTPAASVEQADFRALLLRVDVCPIALRTSRGVSFAPCLSSNIGQMKVGGKRSAVASPDPKGKFWVDLGLSAELRLVSEPLFMALSLGGFVPIKRYSYGFDQPDQQPFFTTSAVLASGLLALGVEL